jgi:nucleoside-diphosphate-sugar epimerase
MLNCSRKYGVKRFIYSSSSSVYGNVETTPTPESHKLNPISPYALQKLIGEQYCKLFTELYGLETVCLRYFNVYGERQLLEGAYCLVMGIFARQKAPSNNCLSPYTLKYLKQTVSKPYNSVNNLQYCSPINFCKAYGEIGFNL